MALLDEELPRAGLDLLLDELELPLGQAETFDVLGRVGIRIREQDLGWRLLDDRSADRAVEHVARALRREAHHAVELAPGLRTVLGEPLEGRIGQKLPELVHPADELPAIEQLADDVEQVERDRRACQCVVEELGDIDSEQAGLRELADEGVLRIVEHPGIVSLRALAPSGKAHVDTFRSGRVGELDQPRQPARCGLKRKGPHQRRVEIPLLSDRQWDRAAHQRTQPDLQKLDGLGRRGKLQRIEPGGYAIPEREVGTTQRPRQDIEAPVLVEDHLRHTLPREQGHEKADQDGLS
ncbi:MAG: hypothetical protein CMLOHMNK_01519 [Steroidobacteraceae bacterium]|nr:hypothetical protein [Steroidobacteraceae bacterium]